MVEKTIQDYYEEIYNMYPNIPKTDIKRILQYGFKSLYLHNSYGGDVLLNLLKFWFYVGSLMNDSLKYFDYYKKKMSIKLRILYNRQKVKWDGFYYFALTANEYKEYLDSKHKRGRPKKYFTFNKIILYKIFDECNIRESNRVAIFKVPSYIDYGFTLYKKEFKTSEAKLILERPPLTFNDILLTNYDYQLIKHG